MKKHILTAAILLTAATNYAQQSLNTAENAVRYTTDNLTGTARFRAMGGAFGAIGGDLSAINVNPAGSQYLITIREQHRYQAITLVTILNTLEQTKEKTITALILIN